MTERMGYWVDTADAVPHHGPLLRRVGVVGAEADPRRRACSSRTTGSRRTAPAAGPGCPTTSSRRATRRSSTRRSTCGSRSPPGRTPGGPACWCGRPRRGRWCPTPPSRCTRTSTTWSPPTAARRWSWREPLFESVLGEGWTVQDTVTGKDMERWAYQRPFELVDFPEPACTSWCSPTTSPPRTAPAWCTSPPPSARTTWRSPAATACRWSTRSARRPLRRRPPPGRRPVLQARRRRPGRGPRAPRAAVPAPALRALLPALLALPHRADVLRPAVLVRPHHRRSRTRCCARTRRPPGTRTPSSGAATATGWTTTSTGRCPAAATGARRCRSGAARPDTRPVSGSLAELCRLTGTDQSGSTRTGRTSTRSPSPAPSAGDDECADPRVPEVIDAWFDCGSMPFAQWGYPHLAGSAERFDAAYPADFICEAIDQTRGWFYTLMAIGTLVFDQSSYRERALPRPHPRRGRPEDVQAPRQHPRADAADGPARRRRGALVHGRVRLPVGGPPGRCTAPCRRSSARCC